MKKTLQLKDIDPMIFAGIRDQNIKLIENNFNSKIVLRGNELHFDGSKNELILLESLVNDIIMNGYEIGGGSIRIHDKKLQSKIFDLLGISKQDAEEKFGFLMNAFKYGAPPHGGMAFGFDRLIMLLAGSNQIRDVMAFPKTTSAMSLMDNSPSPVYNDQLEELGLSVNNKK